jgi:hypothetical protein
VGEDAPLRYARRLQCGSTRATMRWHGWRPPCAATSNDCAGDRRRAGGRGPRLRLVSALRRWRTESLA